MVNIEDSRELRSYLVERLRESAGGGDRVHGGTVGFAFEVLSGGVSNRTVRVGLPDGEAWVLKQALDKLRVPIDWFCSPERIHREALGMKLLSTLLPRGAVPRLIFEDRVNNILVMEAVPEPIRNWKEVLLSGELRTRTVQDVAGLLAAIHAGGLRLRDSLPEELFDHTYFWNLRLEPYYRYTAGRVGEARSMLDELVHGYEGRRQTLVHGDFSPKNVLLSRGRPVLLDHEVIHVGDPAFDIGFSLTHLLSKAHHLRDHRTAFTRAAATYWAAYRSATPDAARRAFGDDLEQRAVRHTLGCLLARAAGRSQLEYLTDEEKARQVDAVLEVLHTGPAGIIELITRFVAALDRLEARLRRPGPRRDRWRAR